MTEADKINRLIEDFSIVFEKTDMDVCRSIKDIWYFTRYNGEYDYYDCFYRFTTFEEFKSVLLEELEFDREFAEQPEANESHKTLDFQKYIDLIKEWDC